MSSPSEAITSLNQSRYAPDLVKKLLVAWGCGLLFGITLFLLVGFTAAFVGAAVGSFGSFDASNWIYLTLCAAPFAILPGPILLGSFLQQSWRKGIKSGVVASIMGLILFAVAVELFSLVPSDWRQSYLFSVFSTMVPGIILAVMGITFIWKASKDIPHRALGLGIGFICGLCLSVLAILSNRTLHVFWITPPLVWVSTVYFPELLAGHSGWKGFLMWGLLILIPFGLPYVVVPLLR